MKSLTEPLAPDSVRRQSHLRVSIRGINRSTAGLYFAIVLLLLSVGVGIYTDLQSREIQRIQSSIDLRLLRVQILNESINNTLSAALLDQNILRAANYGTLSEDLQRTLFEVRALTRPLRMAAEGERLAQQSERLELTRSRAMALMNDELGARRVNCCLMMLICERAKFPRSAAIWL